jgi:PAS domain S-box-containing protein
MISQAQPPFSSSAHHTAHDLSDLKRTSRRVRFVLIPAIWLGAILWIVDGVSHAVVLQDGSLQIVAPLPLGFWLRAIGASCALVAAGYVHLAYKEVLVWRATLVEERAWLRILIDTLPDFLYVKDLNRRIVVVNKALAHEFGFEDPEQLVGKSDADLMPAELASAYAADELKLLRGELSCIHCEHDTANASDTDDWRVAMKLPVYDADDRIIGLVGIGRSIGERKKIENALREANEHLNATLKALPVLLFEFDRSGTFLECHTLDPDLLYAPREELLGKTIREKLPGDLADLAMTAIEKHFASGETVGSIYQLDTPAGKRWFEFQVSPHTFQNDTEADRCILLTHDITDLKNASARLEDLLQSEREQRLVAETLNEVFLALASQNSHTAVMDEILQQVKRLVDYRIAFIAVIVNDNVCIQRWRNDPGFNMQEQAERVYAEHTLAGFPLQEITFGQLQPLVVPDTTREPRWRFTEGFEWIRSHISYPLNTRGQMMGMLMLYNDTPDAFSEADIKRLRSLANIAAITLENTRLYDQAQQEIIERQEAEIALQAAYDNLENRVQERTRQLAKTNTQLQQEIVVRKMAEATLQRRNTQLRTAVEVSTSTSTILDPQELMDTTVSVIRERFDFFCVALFLNDETNENAILKAATGDTGRKMMAEGYRIPIDEQSVIGYAIAKNMPSFLHDDVRLPTIPGGNRLPQTRAQVILPLHVLTTGTIGAISIYIQGSDGLPQEDIMVLQTVADQIAIAIENARLYDAAQEEITRRIRAEEALSQLNASLERRVIERTNELAAANRELSAFAYSVSHDLRAPLRSITGFSQALTEDHSDQLDTTGQDYLARLQAAGQRMGQLIDDLLQLSRVTRSEMHRDNVDLSKLAHDIVSDLQQAEPDRSATITITPGILTRGDQRLLQIVMENLLSNAWKFSSHHEHATITFGMLNQEHNPIYFVRDDGAGFDMDYADKLFGAFQRLHTTEEFEGSGIGLATVQRIIHRHGGEIWAEAAPEQGATFYFKLWRSTGNGA